MFISSLYFVISFHGEFCSCLIQVFATPEASIGFHTDCGFSYMLSRLPGHLGKI